MFYELQLSPPDIESITADWLKCSEITTLRLDSMHPELGGNKWFKLKLNLEEATKQGKSTLLSFGGAYSNHLRALAAAGNLFGFKTIGLVRGEIVTPLNPSLAFAVSQGMELIPVSRSQYRLKSTPSFLEQLRIIHGDPYIIPEGGSNLLGVRGCMDIASYLPEQKDGQNRVLVLACGTGATMGGLIAGLQSHAISNIEVIGISVLKAPGYIASEVEGYVVQLMRETNIDSFSWQVIDEFHCGGYGKISSQLESFMVEWTRTINVPIEGVYSGKMFWGIEQLCMKGLIKDESEIIAIHTGGLY